MTKSYKEYPDEYFKLLEDFSSELKDMEIEGTLSELTYVRHDLYRFFKKIHLEAKRGDKYAQELAEVIRDLLISLSPSRGSRDTPAKLTIKINPLVKIVNEYNPKGEKNDKS